MYSGSVRQFNREGNGEYEYSNGSKYVGEWRDNEKNGYGKTLLTQERRNFQTGTYTREDLRTIRNMEQIVNIGGGRVRS